MPAMTHLSHAATLLAAANGSVPDHEAWIFWILAPICVSAAIGLVLARSAVHGAVLLAVVMLCLAAFYTVEDAPFLAVVQVIVYTGAVLMLFLFVLMLIGVDSTESLIETLKGQRLAAIVIGLGFAVLMIAALAGALGGFTSPGVSAAVGSRGNVAAVADLLFSRYVFAFELTSSLLITAGLGAMVLGHRERITRRKTQEEIMRERFERADASAAPLPGPGVYANHDAVDTPALLPDGSTAIESVPSYLQVSGARPRTAAIDQEIAEELER